MPLGLTVITDKSRSVYTYGYNISKETYSQRMARVNEEHNDFQNKYVGYVILAIVLGVFGMGVLGIIYYINWGVKCPMGIC